MTEEHREQLYILIPVIVVDYPAERHSDGVSRLGLRRVLPAQPPEARGLLLLVAGEIRLIISGYDRREVKPADLCLKRPRDAVYLLGKTFRERVGTDIESLSRCLRLKI